MKKLLKITCKDTVLAHKAKHATSFLARTIGLMFARQMQGFDGLLIEHCNSVHTCFMRYPIDVIFLNRDNQIIKIIRSMRPWRFSWMYWRAIKALELPSGTIPESLAEGMSLEVSHV